MCNEQRTEEVRSCIVNKVTFNDNINYFIKIKMRKKNNCVYRQFQITKLKNSNSK